MVDGLVHSDGPVRVTRSTKAVTMWQVLRLMSAGALAACHNPAEPVNNGPPYLAIVAQPQGTQLAQQYRYHVRDLSTLKLLDTTITAAPTDTIILSVLPSTYSIELMDLPRKCRSRYGTEEVVVVPEGTNTRLSRFFVVCGASLSITVATTGVETDSAYVWEIAGAASQQGVLGANDAVVLPELPAGSYTVTLDHVRSNCTFVNDGGASRTVTVSDEGGADVTFNAVCSSSTQRPSILSFSPSYHDGAGVFIARVVSPIRNLVNYYWDITDCHGASVLPGGVRARGGLLDGRTSFADTSTVIGAFEVGVPDAEFQGRCSTLRVEDNYGNTSTTAERPLRDETASRPVVAGFNALLNGSELLRTQFTATDPEGDQVGFFVAAVLRDGILGPADGKQDIGIYNTAGYLGNQVPDLPLGNGIAYTDVYGIILYVVDARGNFTRLEDMDTFQ